MFLSLLYFIYSLSCPFDYTVLTVSHTHTHIYLWRSQYQHLFCVIFFFLIWYSLNQSTKCDDAERRKKWSKTDLCRPVGSTICMYVELLTAILFSYTFKWLLNWKLRLRQRQHNRSHFICSIVCVCVLVCYIAIALPFIGYAQKSAKNMAKYAKGMIKYANAKGQQLSCVRFSATWFQRSIGIRNISTHFNSNLEFLELIWFDSVAQIQVISTWTFWINVCVALSTGLMIFFHFNFVFEWKKD